MPTKTTARHDRSLNLEDLWSKTVANSQLIQFSLVTEFTYQNSKFSDGLFKYIDIRKLLTFFRCSLTWEWLITNVYWARPLILWASKVGIPASSWLKRLQEIWRALIREYLRFFHNFFSEMYLPMFLFRFHCFLYCSYQEFLTNIKLYRNVFMYVRMAFFSGLFYDDM